MTITINRHTEDLNLEIRRQTSGSVCAVRGTLVSALVPLATIGDLCVIERRGAHPLPAQIISFSGDQCALAPFGSLDGIGPGCGVKNLAVSPRLLLHGDVRGQVLDALGEPFVRTSVAASRDIHELPLENAAPRALKRRAIEKQLITGIKVVDLLCPIGYGQRLGVFASAGVGKSTLLGMIARQARVDVTVIALVGERGREVQEFLSQNLGEEGLRRAVVVVSTSDESPLRRLMAPKTATSIAEYYRDRGLRVLLLVDSLTRCARAIREVELSAGEIPVRQGYTSGVYVQLPRLLERAGNNEYGSITALYTNLTSGTEEFDPLADELKSILDGHIVLDPHLAREGIRPAIDPLSSISRLFERLCHEEDRSAVSDIVRILSRLRRDRDILLLGGSPDSELRAALAVEPEVRSLLSQGPNEVCDYAQARANLRSTSERFRALLARETVSIETSAT